MSDCVRRMGADLWETPVTLIVNYLVRLQATVVVFGIFFCMKTGIFTLCVCVCVCLCVCGCVCGEATGAVNVR